jgi:hypothetical protein
MKFSQLCLLGCVTAGSVSFADFENTLMEIEDSYTDLRALNMEDMFLTDLLAGGQKFNYGPWGGSCNLMEVGGEFWMVREGADTHGTRVWKT